MKSIQALRLKIFVSLFLLLASVSAISAAVATAALASPSHSAIPATAVALLTSLAVCALASQIVSTTVAAESGRLAASIGGPSEPPYERCGTSQSMFFAEVAAAWEKSALRRERAINRERQKAARSKVDLEELLRTVAKATEERSPLLRGHSNRVAEYSVTIAEELDLDDETIERVRLAALIHDIGMIGIGEPVLRKSRLLAVRDFEILRAHPARGAAILRSIESLHDLIPAVELHHEALDGSGYPYGLTEEDIPLMARILAVADTYDTMTSADPYQQGMEPDQAVEALSQFAGTRLDPMVVAALLHSLDGHDAMSSGATPEERPVLCAGKRAKTEATTPSRAL